MSHQTKFGAAKQRRPGKTGNAFSIAGTKLHYSEIKFHFQVVKYL